MNNIKTIQCAVDELKRVGFRTVVSKDEDSGVESVLIIVSGRSACVFGTCNTEHGFTSMDYTPMEVSKLIADAERAEKLIKDTQNLAPATTIEDEF